MLPVVGEVLLRTGNTKPSTYMGGSPSCGGTATIAARVARGGATCRRGGPSERGGEPAALVDRALGVEFGGDVGAADQVHVLPGGLPGRRASRAAVPGRRRPRRGRPAAVARCRRRGCAGRRRRRPGTPRRRASARPWPSAWRGGSSRWSCPAARRACPGCAAAARPRAPAVRAAACARPPRRLERRVDAPFAHPARRGSSVGEGPSCTRNSATSKPMPPAPMIATRGPARDAARRARRRSCSTFGWSAPGSRPVRGVMPVASTTSSKPAQRCRRRPRVSRRSSTPRLVELVAEVAQRLVELFLARECAWRG